MENSIEQSDTNEESGIDLLSGLCNELLNKTRSSGWQVCTIYCNKQTLKDLQNFGKEEL